MKKKYIIMFGIVNHNLKNIIQHCFAPDSIKLK